MLLEMRIYTMKPGTTPQATERFAEGLPGRAKVSPLAGFFRTEIGPLNQIIMLWPYETLGEYERLRNVKVEGWPPKLAEFVIEMESTILTAAPFSPRIEPRNYGELYELRRYNYSPGSIPHVITEWGKQIEARQKYSPLVFAGSSELGLLNQWVHIWAYKDYAERQRARDDARKAGVWPTKPNPGAVVLKQQNALVIPAAFSPWR
jgi:hypothetical protein